MFKPKKKFSRIKRWAMVIALAFFICQLALPVLVAPKPAQAFLGLPSLSITLDDIFARIWNSIEKAAKTAADVAFKNVIKNYLNNLAYNYAMEIATGTPGQKPLFHTKPMDLLDQTWEAAAGDFLDDLATSWVQGTCEGYSDKECFKDTDCLSPVLKCPISMLDVNCTSSKEQKHQCLASGCSVLDCSTGADCDRGEQPKDVFYDYGAPGECLKNFSLCEPRDITTKIKLQVWARQATFGGPIQITAKCPLSDIIDNVEATQSQRLFELSKSFNPEATDFGAYLEIIDAAGEKAAREEEKKAFEAQLGGEMEAVKTPISGEVKTPGVFLEQGQGAIFSQSIGQTFVQTGSMVADAIGTFTNTLSSQLLDQLINKGWNPFASGSKGDGGGGFFGGFFGGSSPGIKAAKLLFADLEQTNYSVGGDFDILSKLASCPDNVDPTPDTCVMDSRFRTAIDQKLTVREALDQGLLDGAKLFGFDDEGDELEWNDGYPYRSLVILRKYRIIPVGWELAAQYMKQYAQGGYSLNTLIDDYDNPDSPFYHLVDPNWVLKSPDVYCMREGVGPKILSSETVEESIGVDDDNNPILIASNFIQRQTDYCADEQMCLAENEDGSCKKYGYCVEEKPIWKFDGTGCESQNNSCQAFEQRGGGQVSYLKNTVDYDSCTADNAGCQWYCQDWNTATTQWDCTNEEPPAGGNKISFNKNIEECSSASEGCNEFIRTVGTGTNLLKNSDFENFVRTADASLRTDGIKDDGDPLAGSLPDQFSYWSHDSLDAGLLLCGARRLAVRDAFEGQTAARLHTYGNPCSATDSGNWMTQSLDSGYLTDNHSFTVSFYAKRAAGDLDCDPANPDVGHLNFGISRLVDTRPAGDPNRYWDQPPRSSVNATDTWTRYTATFTFGSVPVDGHNWYAYNAAGPDNLPEDLARIQRQMQIIFGGFDACDVVIDNVQLEEGNITGYKTYANSTKAYLRKAPDYYNCYDDNPGNDDPACSNYVLSCSQDEVGCQAYTSLTSGQIINGIITNPNACDLNDPTSCDQCPAEFLGCRAYRELPIEHLPYRPARDPVSFVAATGQSCPASAVGCEEYTNLEEVERGGEGKEYYSWIKLCVNSDDLNVKTYYTWEGSDEFGYQLKSYRLKESNDGSSAPCTNVAAENSDYGGNSWPACVDGIDFDEDLDGLTMEPHPAATCDPADVGVNPDCTEFYDSDGNTYYRLRTRIIYASEDCRAYRNSNDSPDVLYHLIPGQGFSCQAVHAGCRAYKGNAGDNIRQIYFGDFEAGTISPWTGNAVYSNESINVGGHSMLVANSAAIDNIGEFLGFQDDSSYNVTFWAKGTVASSPVTFAINTSPNLIFPGQAIAQSGDWNRYELGPLYIPAGTDLSTNQLLVFSDNAFYIDNITITEVFENIYLIKDSYTDCSGYENCDQYADGAGSTHYLKSFSRLCSEDKVGCEVMVDTKNSSSPSSSTYQLAISDKLRGDMTAPAGVDPADLVYLDAYLNTGGPAPSPWETGDVNFDGIVDSNDYDYLNAYFNAGGSPPLPVYIYERGTVPADEVMTLVNDTSKACSTLDKGCQKLGRPALDADGNASSFTSTYLRNDPDKYGSIVCLYEHSSCEEYTTPGGSKLYFKEPGGKTCEFKRVAGQDVSGWYQLGTDQGPPDCPMPGGICSGSATNANELCYRGGADPDADCDGGICAVGVCVGGGDEGDQCVADAGCAAPGVCDEYNLVPRPMDNWVGLCPSTASGCTEYRDPEDPEVCNVALADGAGHSKTTPDCTSYYYINDTVDEGACNGLVSREQGCLLFNDTANPDLPYDSSASVDGEVPTLCSETSPANCDSNMILKIIKDRECKRWLECATSWSRAEGGEELCTGLIMCDKMDEQTRHCTGFPNYSQANQTYSTPAFVDQIKNYSGMVLAGLSWGQRCSNDPSISCNVNADCGDGNCQAQIIEGNLPYPAMYEVGSVSAGGDLIDQGDFADSDEEKNSDLSEYIIVEGNNDHLDLSDLTAQWQPRADGADIPSAFWTEESAVGEAPSTTKNFDENNVAWVQTNGQYTGVYYNLQNSIISDEAYVVSFRLRLGVPSDDRIIVEFVYSLDDSVVGRQRIADIYPTDQWQEFTLGPITAGYDSNGNLLTYGNTRLDIILGSDRSGVEFFLDDISMKPVLKVQEPDNMITRSCRLYPKNDSPYCVYTDKANTTYNGWQGYCLEWDPKEKDPKYPKYCINWWPVDLLAGESDVFSTLRTAGYTGRRPLYYCLQAEGNEEPRMELNLSPFTGADYYVSPGTVGFVGNGGTEACCDTDDCDMSHNHDCSEPDIVSCNWSCNIVMSVSVNNTNITEDNIQEITLSWESWGAQNWDVLQPRFNKSTVSSGSLCSSCGNYPHQYQRINDGVNPIYWYLYPTECKDSDEDDDNSPCLWIQFRFNQSSKELEQVRWLSEDSKDSDEGAWLDLHFRLHEPCQRIVQVAGSSGEPKVWAERIKSSPGYKVGDTSQSSDLFYQYNQDYAPFGGIVNPSNNDPSGWPMIFVEQRENPPTDSNARAGSPYTCEEKCEVRVCNWNDNNYCLSDTQIDVCLEGDDEILGTPDDGYCIGLGDGFCSKDPTQRCDIVNGDSDCTGGSGDTCMTNMGGIWAGEKLVSDGVERFKRIFAAPVAAGPGNAGWSWDYSALSYIPDDASTGVTGWNDDYDQMSQCPGNTRPSSDFAGEYCGVPPRVEVIEPETDRVLPGGGSVEFILNIIADPQQEPIKLIEVDWDSDDIADYSTTGQYDSGSIVLTHEFNQVREYHPRIRVVDNWDWCTGNNRAIDNNGNAVECAWTRIQTPNGLDLTIRVE